MKMKSMYLVALIIIIVVGAWYFFSGPQPEVTPDTAREQTEGTQQGTQKQTSPKPSATTPSSTPAPAGTAPSSSPDPTPKITYNNTNESEIFVVLPKPGQTVTPNITISGTVRGFWFFQDAIIAEVYAKNGDMLVRNNVPPKGNANSTDLIQFSSSVLISPNYRGDATVVIRSDTPPGHPYPDRSVSIPVTVQ